MCAHQIINIYQLVRRSRQSPCKSTPNCGPVADPLDEIPDCDAPSPAGNPFAGQVAVPAGTPRRAPMRGKVASPVTPQDATLRRNTHRPIGTSVQRYSAQRAVVFDPPWARNASAGYGRARAAWRPASRWDRAGRVWAPPHLFHLKKMARIFEETAVAVEQVKFHGEVPKSEGVRQGRLSI